MKNMKLLDKEFEVYIPSSKIQSTIKGLADRINTDLRDTNTIFLSILNGSFLFAADLYRLTDFNSQISFLKLASYQGVSTTGKVKRLIGINEDIKDQTVVIIEDIIDTGITMDNIIKQLKGYEPKDIKIATLLFKPDALQKEMTIDYCGFEIPNEFVVGYGLDYNGYGRNFQDIYKESE